MDRTLYVFFWVFPRRPIVVCPRFGTLYQFHLQGLDVKYKVLYIQPLKMELTERSEKSANYNRTPGKYPKDYIHDSKHGESLKSRYYFDSLRMVPRLPDTLLENANWSCYCICDFPQVVVCLLGFWFTKRMKSHLDTNLTTYITAGNKGFNSHAKETTTFQPSMSLTGMHQFRSHTSNVLFCHKCKVKAVLVSRQQYWLFVWTYWSANTGNVGRLTVVAVQKQEVLHILSVCP